MSNAKVRHRRRRRAKRTLLLIRTESALTGVYGHCIHPGTTEDHVDVQFWLHPSGWDPYDNYVANSKDST